MKVLIYISLLFVPVIACKKEVNTKPESFLVLRLQEQEEDIRWETLSSCWNDSLGNADIEASSSYDFNRCSIHLKNIFGPVEISPVMLTQFYYTDGIDFMPYAVSGTLTITRANNKEIEGTFTLHFENNYNGVSGNNITGRFGIINP